MQPNPQPSSVMADQDPREGQYKGAAAPPRQQRRPDITSLYAEFQDWLKQFERNFAAFNSLQRSLNSFLRPIEPGERQQPGERRKGLPVLRFPASANGREAIECVLDVSKVNPEHVQHVLVPLINLAAGEMLEAMEEVAARFAMLRPLLLNAAGMPEAEAQPQQPQQLQQPQRQQVVGSA